MALYISLFAEHLDDLPTLNYASYHVAISCTIEHEWFKWAFMFIIIIAVYYLQLDVISYKRCKWAFCGRSSVLDTLMTPCH